MGHPRSPEGKKLDEWRKMTNDRIEPTILMYYNMGKKIAQTCREREKAGRKDYFISRPTINIKPCPCPSRSRRSSSPLVQDKRASSSPWVGGSFLLFHLSGSLRVSAGGSWLSRIIHGRSHIFWRLNSYICRLCSCWVALSMFCGLPILKKGKALVTTHTRNKYVDIMFKTSKRPALLTNDLVPNHGKQLATNTKKKHHWVWEPKVSSFHFGRNWNEIVGSKTLILLI